MTFRFSQLAAPLICAALVAPAFAQQPAKPPAKQAAKPAAKATQSKRPVAKKTPPPPPVEAPLPDAPPEQLAAAERTYFGSYSCEFDQTLSIAMNPKAPGYVDVDFKKQVYTMKPVLSTTGALRLEDVKGRALMIQIANKSMLMDVKAGQRLVDDCMHERQRTARLEMQANPPTSSLGIDPVKAAAVAAQSAASAAEAAATAASAADQAARAANAAANAASAAAPR